MMITRSKKRQSKDDNDKYPLNYFINTLTNINNMADNENNTDSVVTTADVHNPTSANPPTNTNNSITPARASSGINALPPELLKNLRGIGSHASRIPTFDNNQKNFNNWIRALQHFLLINGSHEHLQATTISAADNLALYMLIATCLSGSSLELVQTQAFQDGQKPLNY